MAEQLKAFVGGATGYTGRSVVSHCRSRGIETVAHVRPDSPRLEHWRGIFEGQGAIVDSSPWTGEAMARTLAVHHPTHVFALLGTTRARDRGSEADAISGYETVDYCLTKHLLDASAPVGARFIYLSVLGADRAFASGSGYTQVRARIEAEVRASGLSYLIARPAFVSGPDREETRPMERLGATVSDGLLSVAAALGGSRLRDRFASLTGDELARALVGLGFGDGESMIAEPGQLRAAAIAPPPP